MLALSLAIYEATLCGGCGQELHLSMDGDLADEWTTAEADRCHACTALSRASESINDAKRDHPSALKITPGLREGWESRLAEARATRAAGEG